MDKSEINLRMRKTGIFAIRLVYRMLKQTFPRLNSFALVVLILLTGLSACYRSARGLDNFPAEGNPVQNDDEFLEMVQRKGFDFFWEAYNPETGLILECLKINAALLGPDHWQNNRAGLTSVGFGLSAYCIADERGWKDHDEIYKRVLKLLNAFIKDPNDENDFCVEGTHGFFYHMFDINTGKRWGEWQVSTTGTAILMTGVLHAMEHFKGTEIETLADQIYRNAEWDWFLTEKGSVSAGWKPENPGKGIYGDYRMYNEYVTVYLLGMGSPTHPLPRESWDVWNSGPGVTPVKPYKDIPAFHAPAGFPLAYLYQFPACWFDFRGKKDKYGIDYWAMGINALKSNRRHCQEWAKKENDNTSWGWNACEGRDDYLGFGRPYDGTISPSAVAGAIPYFPEVAIADLRDLYERYQDKAFLKWGFVESFNPYQSWYNDGYLGLDQGNLVIMIENYRTGLVWEETMRSPYVQTGMKQAGFK